MKQMLFFSLLLMCACATRHGELNMHGIHHFDDAEVFFSEVVESVRPVSLPVSRLTGLMLPFTVRQDIGVRKDTGREIGSVFWRELLASGKFTALEYAQKDRADLTQALAQARLQGADVLIVGTIGNFFESGAAGRTSLSVTLQMYWVQQGTCLWAATQAASMEGAPDKDYVLVRSTRRLPADPTFAVSRALAQSLVAELGKYLPASPPGNR